MKHGQDARATPAGKGFARPSFLFVLIVGRASARPRASRRLPLRPSRAGGDHAVLLHCLCDHSVVTKSLTPRTRLRLSIACPCATARGCAVRPVCAECRADLSYRDRAQRTDAMCVCASLERRRVTHAELPLVKLRGRKPTINKTVAITRAGRLPIAAFTARRYAEADPDSQGAK